MIVFPPCKINLGLYVTGKRSDGFHDLETVFYAIPWCDALEVVEQPGAKAFELTLSGRKLPGSPEDNILFKAWQLVSNEHSLPPLLVHLRKNVPAGAGLGGGSADAAFFIRLIDQKFSLHITEEKKNTMAAKLGSDCAFFLQDEPQLARGRGNEFEPVQPPLGRYYILLVHPGIHSSTAEAFQLLTPAKPPHDLRIALGGPVMEWKNTVNNDFEKVLFPKYPELATIKQLLYESGAVYAAMSGSGSTLFGIFEKKPSLQFPTHYHQFLRAPLREIL